MVLPQDQTRSNRGTKGTSSVNFNLTSNSNVFHFILTPKHWLCLYFFFFPPNNHYLTTLRKNF